MFASRLSSTLPFVSRNLFQSVSLRFYSAKLTMEKHQVVPDVVPVAPTEVATVTYNSGVSCNEGNELTPRQVKDIPKVEWNADASDFYTLCMTDPDAPSRQEPTFREVSLNKKKHIFDHVSTFFNIFFFYRLLVASLACR